MKYFTYAAAGAIAACLANPAGAAPFQQTFNDRLTAVIATPATPGEAGMPGVSVDMVDAAVPSQDPFLVTVAPAAMPTPDALPVQLATGRLSVEARPSVIRFSDTDPKTLAAMQEDLNIMSRILEKATRVTGANQPFEAMGVKLLTATGGGGPRSMQIEGQGAFFFLNTGIPLTGPPAKAESDATKEPTNSTWEQTRRELQGGTAYDIVRNYNNNFAKDPSQPQEAYDAKRVEKLKDLLLDALKNASNMGHLKPEESVTLVVSSGTRQPERYALVARPNNGDPVINVQGTITSGYSRPRPGASAPPGATGTTSGTSPTPGTTGGAVNTRRSVAYNNPPVWRGGGDAAGSTMTIRVKKADIDSFAKGKLSAQEFRGKATILIY